MKKTLEQRFWGRVNKTPGLGPRGTCWIWHGAFNKGYPIFPVERRNQPASRVAYELKNGKLSPAYRLEKYCANPLCVRHFRPVMKLAFMFSSSEVAS